MDKVFSRPRNLFFAIFILSVLARLIPLIFFTGTDNAGPGWYTDAYHHWQIGYFSKEVGFKHGFLRLWDLKGMEYFWGIGHPLALSFLFFITGSSSLLVPRLLSVFSGAVVAGLMGVLILRWFNSKAAWAVGIWAAAQPIAVFSDQIGLQGPLGLVLLILGIYFWPKKPFVTGLFWALAGTVRAEFWLFGAGLVAVSLFKTKSFDKKVILLLSYLIVAGVHMKILLDKTGNPIYPIWWNFFANVKGDWLPPVPEGPTILLVGTAMKIAFGALVLIGLWIVYKKPKGFLFWSLGIFNLGFLAFMGGFSAYVIYFRLLRFWVDRLWTFPYTFLGAVLAVFLFWYLPRTVGVFKKITNLFWIPYLSLLIILSIISWPFMIDYFNKRSIWEETKHLASITGRSYEGGNVLIPVDRPDLTYSLVHFENIKAEDIKGQMFTPFYYMDDEAPFDNWKEHREEVLSWLVKEDVRLLVIREFGKGDYGKLVMKEARVFELVAKEMYPRLWVYRVKLDEI